ncbi:MAG: c-di-GMP-binding flagellar brake protein YcgR, partial [Candidatus Azotimanducaceae bacterium]
MLMELEDNLVTDKIRVAQIMQGLAQAHSRLQIILTETNETASTMVIGVEPTTETLLLDEIMPRYIRVGPNSELVVHGKLKGVPIRFKTRIAGVDNQDGIDAYACTLPSDIYYDQKRSDFRFSPGISNRPSMRLISASGEVTGEVINISAGGAKLELLNTNGEFSEGIDVDCQVQFDEDSKFNLTVKVRYQKDNTAHLGVQFMQLTQPARRDRKS